jgi:hypothetical protein
MIPAMATHRRRGATVALLAFASSLATGVAPEQAGSVAPTCAGPYAYAGAAGLVPATGVAATVRTVARPQLARTGQVAAWVGVGGPGLGPGGADAWIQAGLVAFGNGRTRIYHEVTRPGRKPVYTEVAAGVAIGERHRFVVAQVSAERWAVVVDGRRVVGPVHLPGSGSWRAVATAESWVRGARGCNRMTYGFEDVTVRTPRRAWARLDEHALIETAGYSVLRGSAGSFRVITSPKIRTSRRN